MDVTSRILTILISLEQYQRLLARLDYLTKLDTPKHQASVTLATAVLTCCNFVGDLLCYAGIQMLKAFL